MMAPASESRADIGVLGGTGKEGSGLALRWADAGHRVMIGSREPVRAQAAADGINARLGTARVYGASNEAAARFATIAVLTVPYAAQLATLRSVSEHLAGKILIDVTVPLIPPRVSDVQLPSTGSAVVAAQALLGSGIRVVSAFQNVSAEHLRELGHPIDCDVLVCADDPAAREQVVQLARSIGIRAFNAGKLTNSAGAEALTSVLIAINRHYNIKNAGIRLTGIPPE
jgi:NADPH-dependent F420 reductase